jgi:hypothetical protein
MNGSGAGPRLDARPDDGEQLVQGFAVFSLRAHDYALSTSFATASAAALYASASMCV